MVISYSTKIIETLILSNAGVKINALYLKVYRMLQENVIIFLYPLKSSWSSQLSQVCKIAGTPTPFLLRSGG